MTSVVSLQLPSPEPEEVRGNLAQTNPTEAAEETFPPRGGDDGPDDTCNRRNLNN